MGFIDIHCCQSSWNSIVHYYQINIQTCVCVWEGGGAVSSIEGQAGQDWKVYSSTAQLLFSDTCLQRLSGNILVLVSTMEEWH